MKYRRLTGILLILIMFLLVPFQTSAATPVIKDTEAYPPTCYFHYDGKIAVYATSRYKDEIKKAINLLNRKFNVFYYTNSKAGRDVLIRDKKKPPKKTIIARTWHYNGNIILYRKSMNRLRKKDRILTIAHELGHTAGLNHSSSRKSLMYPWINKMKAKNLSSADVAGLRLAKKEADKENLYRKGFREACLSYEAKGWKIPLEYGAYILTFPERGTSYHSSNTRVLKVYPTGYILVKKAGNVTLTVKNAGKVHKFIITVR